MNSIKVYYIRDQQIQAYKVMRVCQVLLWHNHKIFKSYKQLITIAMKLQSMGLYEYYGDICNHVLGGGELY